jgi:hypothetical protein
MPFIVLNSSQRGRGYATSRFYPGRPRQSYIGSALRCRAPCGQLQRLSWLPSPALLLQPPTSVHKVQPVRSANWIERGKTAGNGSGPECRSLPERAQNAPCPAGAVRQTGAGRTGSNLRLPLTRGLPCHWTIPAMGWLAGAGPASLPSQGSVSSGPPEPPSNWSSEPSDIPVRPLTPPGVAGGLLCWPQGRVFALVATQLPGSPR